MNLLMLTIVLIAVNQRITGSILVFQTVLSGSSVLLRVPLK
eukprot:CAMPEP_0173075158 /NCGR_PEP_ID=MMETSP1102-20130122/11461_1 /TAXON_ID=49646 /ORGANISM="Geminigera sp., Strain Caron Lab Isolate" /LENGTH=40 /DNA_ID= /DNA_START= /DNA_END= /DNA_ORIENTATION=